MITVLIPTYREGPLINSCIRSVTDLPGVDHVAIFEGPVGGAEPSSERHLPIEQLPHSFGSTKRFLHARLGEWEDDADKRSSMVAYAKARHFEHYNRIAGVGVSEDDLPPLWVFWLDGDEVLLWGEYLIDWVNRAEKETGAGGFSLRLVELDGSVAKTHNRIVRGDLIEHYVHSSVSIQLRSGVIVSLPNVQICGAGGVPVWNAEKEGRPIVADDLMDLRPPVAGEPHILHRSILRDPARALVARRQSDAEMDFFRQ